jgi:hypothetical protein
MYQLLEKHGGIETLRLFALAWQVSIADLLHAAHTIRKPLYPMVDIYGQRLELDLLSCYLRPTDVVILTITLRRKNRDLALTNFCL